MIVYTNCKSETLAEINFAILYLCGIARVATSSTIQGDLPSDDIVIKQV